MSWAKSTIEKRIEHENGKKTLLDMYGGVMFWLWEVVGKWILGILGAVADSAVIFSILFLSFKHFTGCLIAAIVAATVMQVVFGVSGLPMLISYFRKDYTKDGFKAMMSFNLIIIIFIFGGTIYLTFNTDKTAVAVADKVFQEEDIHAKDNYYDDKIAKLEAAFQNEKDQLLATYTDLKNDKVMWKGRLTTREMSSRSADQIMNITLPEKEAQHRKAVKDLKQEKSDYQKEAKGRNLSIKNDKERKLATAKTTVVGFNLAINLLRAIFLAAFAYFVVHANREVKQRGDNAQQQQKDNTWDNSTNNASFMRQQHRSNNTVNPVDNRLTGEQQFENNTNEQQEQQHSGQQAEKYSNKHFFNKDRTTGEVLSNNGQDNSKSVAQTTVNHRGNSYDVTIINGEPTLPYVGRNGEVKQLTLDKINKLKNVYKGRIEKRKKGGKGPTATQASNFQMFSEMESTLKKIKNQNQL